MNLETIIYILIFTFVGSILSLAGGFMLLKRGLWEGENSVHLLAFAAGVLLATAFLDLLPEALHESSDNPNIFLGALFGIVVFFLLQRLIVSFHPHQSKVEDHVEQNSITSLILLGDGFHNFIDGFAIASSFFVDTRLGIITALAVGAHEIPQEISDFTILLKNGVKPAKAIWFNILSGLTAIAGAVVAIFISEQLQPYLGFILAFTAGLFIYIASANLIPELQHAYLKERKWHQTVFFAVGIVAVFLMIQFLKFE